ncbi:MAG TPA: zf-HC2 domain-containing protein [Gaiellaceae bacterium]
MRPARCDRSREAISLRLDGMLSSFEAALLERHLRRCAPCRAFAASAEMQTQLLRGAELEQPLHPVVVPSRRRPAARRGVAGSLAAVAAAGVAALVALSPTGPAGQAGGRGATAARGAAPELAVFSAQPTPSTRVDVPRIRAVPANFADGPVHGLFRIPV